MLLQLGLELVHVLIFGVYENDKSISHNKVYGSTCNLMFLNKSKTRSTGRQVSLFAVRVNEGEQLKIRRYVCYYNQ